MGDNVYIIMETPDSHRLIGPFDTWAAAHDWAEKNEYTRYNAVSPRSPEESY